MDKFLFSVSDDSDVPSASILQIEVIHFGKLYKYIRNNRGSKTKPIEKPANMLFHRDVCQFKITSKFFIARKMLSLFIVKKNNRLFISYFNFDNLLEVSTWVH